MKVSIDQEVCINCGICADACPEIFEMGDEITQVIVDDVPSDQEDCVRQAEEDCPVDAIHIEEE